MISYLSAELARVLVSKLPARIAYSIGSAAGDLTFALWSRGRRNSINSISNIVDKEIEEIRIRSIARNNMRNFGKFVVDILRYARADEVFFKRNFTVNGLDNLESVLGEKKGAILVGFHLGNLDLGPRLLAHLGYPVNAVVHHLRFKGMDKFLQGPRLKSGIKLLGSNETADHFLEVLRHNEILALMMDVPNCNKGIKVKLGRDKVMIPSGAAILSLRTGAPIIPCGLVRSSNTTFKAIIGQPIKHKSSGRISQDIFQLTQNTVSEIEKLIKPYIDQWYVFHSLFQNEVRETEFRETPGIALSTID